MAIVANAPFTIESWFYIASGTPTWVGIATKNRDVSCNDSPPYCDWAGVWIGGSGELTYAWDWHNQGNMGGGAALSTGTWYYGAIVFDGGMRTGYRNGARDTVITAPNPAPGIYTDLIMPTRMNSDMTGGSMMTGTIDEVRVSTVARSPGWILTTWDNMNTPGNIGTPGFYTVGSEVEIGSPPSRIARTQQRSTTRFTTASTGARTGRPAPMRSPIPTLVTRISISKSRGLIPSARSKPSCGRTATSASEMT